MAMPTRSPVYTAVRVYSQGHVVAFNYVANFHDGIDVVTYVDPDGSDAVHGPLYPARKDWDRRTGVARAALWATAVKFRQRKPAAARCRLQTGGDHGDIRKQSARNSG